MRPNNELVRGFTDHTKQERLDADRVNMLNEYDSLQYNIRMVMDNWQKCAKFTNRK